jgi:hypothetical protein
MARFCFFASMFIFFVAELPPKPSTGHRCCNILVLAVAKPQNVRVKLTATHDSIGFAQCGAVIESTNGSRAPQTPWQDTQGARKTHEFSGTKWLQRRHYHFLYSITSPLILAHVSAG